MRNLNIPIFILPVIALTVVVIMFKKVINSVTNKLLFRRFTIKVLIIGIALNAAWELIQLPLYQNASYTLNHIAICSLASLADVIMMMLLYFGFALIYNEPYWHRQFSFQRLWILIVVGGIGGILGELRNINKGNWAYENSMPIIPGIDVGLYPVIQFMFLPALCYYLSLLFEKKVL